MERVCYNTNNSFTIGAKFPFVCSGQISAISTCTNCSWGGSKLPHLSKKSIETIAGRITAAYKRLPTLQGQNPDKVQPELLAHDLLGLTTEYHTLSRNGGILGLTACGEMDVQIYDNPRCPEFFHLDGKTLLIDSYLVKEGSNKGRYHFTLTHEACHQIFKMLFPREYTAPVRLCKIHYCKAVPSESADYWEEWRTNALASAVLMPEDMVRSNMLAFGLGEKIPMLNRVYATEDYNRFTDMANYMGVSKQALAIRLKGLGLLERDYLQEPYTLADVNPDDEELKRL